VLSPVRRSWFLGASLHCNPSWNLSPPVYRRRGDSFFFRDVAELSLWSSASVF